MKKWTIYKLTNIVNGKCYIGKTLTYRFKKRVNAHSLAKSESYLHQEIRKYGWNNFTTEVLHEVHDEEQADSLEISYIADYDTFRNGYNEQTGGSSGYKFSNRARRRMSESANKRWDNPEERRKFSETCKGRKVSDETKKKIALAGTGRKHTLESRQKMSRVQKGKPSWAKGKRFSDEHKRKISESHKGKIVSEKSKRKSTETKLGMPPLAAHIRMHLCIRAGWSLSRIRREMGFSWTTIAKYREYHEYFRPDKSR